MLEQESKRNPWIGLSQLQPQTGGEYPDNKNNDDKTATNERLKGKTKKTFL